MTDGIDAALAGARARRADDGDDPAVPVAATVVLVRDDADGPEVLLLQRPDRGSFGGAWVFPGGRVEPADRGAGESEAQSAARAAVRETAEETGLEVDAGALTLMSRWDPPPGIAVRFRTWFFIGVAPASPMVLSPHEVVEARWLRPADALTEHGRGALRLFPPTWVTLHDLAGHTSADALVSAVRRAGRRDFDTEVRTSAGGALFLWAGDAQYPRADTGEAAASSARHRLDTSALPWRLTRRA